MIAEFESHWSNLCDRLGVSPNEEQATFRRMAEANSDLFRRAYDAMIEARTSHDPPEPHEMAAAFLTFDPDPTVAAVEAQRWVNQHMRHTKLANQVFNLVLLSSTVACSK